MQGWHIGRAVLGRFLSVLLGRFGHPLVLDGEKRRRVKKQGKWAYFLGDIN